MVKHKVDMSAREEVVGVRSFKGGTSLYQSQHSSRQVVYFNAPTSNHRKLGQVMATFCCKISY